MTSKKKRVVKPRVPRTRAGGTLTEAGYWGYIRGILRNGANRYPPKFQVLNAAKKAVVGKRWRWEYTCAECGHGYPKKDVEVDHIIACGSLKGYGDIGRFVERLLCEREGLRVICKGCHKIKTKADREAREKDV